MNKFSCAILITIFSTLATACQSNLPTKAPITTLSIPTPTIVPSPVSTKAWVAVGKTAQRIIYECFEPAGTGGYTSLCDMNANLTDHRYVAHHLISNVLLSEDGQWLFFGLWEGNALGSLYRLQVDNMEVQQLSHGLRFLGYRLERVDDKWLYFQVWTGQDGADPHSWVPHHISLLTGELSELSDS
jgi:hypothetical protein